MYMNHCNMDLCRAVNSTIIFIISYKSVSHFLPDSNIHKMNDNAHTCISCVASTVMCYDSKLHDHDCSALVIHTNVFM